MHLRRTNAKARALTRAGFTLMELLVVVAILLVLAGTTILAFRTILGESRENVARAQCANLKQQLENFAMLPKYGMDYPDPSTGFTALLDTGLLSNIPVDPWGQPYRWNLMPLADGMTPTAVVWSCGPNRTDENGSGDDITSLQ